MLWVILSLSGAVLNAAYFTSIKRYLSDFNPHMLAAGTFLGSGLLLLSLSFFRGLPTIGPQFFPALCTTVFLNVFAVWLTYRALATTDISLSLPMLSFTPLFLLVTSQLLLGEAPSTTGLFGILLIVAGSYLLNIRERGGFLAPIRGLLRTEGVRLMLAVALIYSVTANADKIVILNSDPIFGLSCVVLLLGLIFSAFMLHSPPERGTPVRRILPALVLTSLLLAGEIILIGTALSIQIVPYVISLKRTSILFAVLFGGLYFRERAIAARFAGSAVMVVGVAVIVLFV